MDYTWLTLLCYLQCVLVASIDPPKEDELPLASPLQRPQLCRDRVVGYSKVDYFERSACALCYVHLFPKKMQLRNYMYSFVLNGTLSPNQLLVPDVRNHTFASLICQTLDSADECNRWRSCCLAAYACCKTQLVEPPGQGIMCPRTWDGYGCWGDTKPGTVATETCPTFIAHAMPMKMSSKTCVDNGTHPYWLKRTGMEWTDYTGCVDKQGHVAGVWIGLMCNVISILLLLPATVIFSYYRALRRQDRIKIHINFFLSLAFCGFITILWDMLVQYDLLTVKINSQSVMYKNSIGCRILCALHIYTKCTTYVWMFCEGYYLHKLISNAFEPPNSLVRLYILGWGFPVLPVGAYTVARAILDNKKCWSISIGGFEWIVYGPNLLCLFVNLFFLCNIMRILLTQLHAHPDEPSNFRRGLKAAFVLIPLFGLQLFFTIYNPHGNPALEKTYDKIQKVITNSQGIFVSLIFCFFNGEVGFVVHNQIKRACCPRHRRTDSGSRNLKSVSTHFTDAVHSSGSSLNIFRNSLKAKNSPNLSNKSASLNNLQMSDITKNSPLLKNSPILKNGYDHRKSRDSESPMVYRYSPLRESGEENGRVTPNQGDIKGITESSLTDSSTKHIDSENQSDSSINAQADTVRFQ
ncbi:unnamed protein product [Owenia fusiformis]|uniref:Uncharacterized protein n=1 Tax=Owenia fusiformis TaxID=6347 RepID=A0A8J1UXC6_OWEFU|nr:unnamed protein product [Owenia fusiformis]